MKTAKINVDGKQVTVGMLRSSAFEHRLPLTDAHQLVANINAKHGTSLMLISPRTAHSLLNDNGACKQLEGCISFPTSALAVYEAPGARFQYDVKSADGRAIVIVPPRFLGSKDMALVAVGITGSDFIRAGKMTRIAVPDNQWVVVEQFPLHDRGLFDTHPETAVPQGDRKVNASTRLARRRVPHIGPIMRRMLAFDEDPVRARSRVYMDSGLDSLSTGVLVEIQDADLPKIDQIA